MTIASPPSADVTIGRETRAAPLEIALVGNPNVGKTTLFNRLTGARQRVGNYPGVTVEKKTGTLDLPGGQSVTVIDLPGTYSLAAASADERVVIDVLTGHIDARRPVRGEPARLRAGKGSPIAKACDWGPHRRQSLDAGAGDGPARKPDVIVCVVDATNLMRNLFLASQMGDLATPMVIVLNMTDQAEEQGISIDAQALSERLGVPVVPIVATKGRGIDELKRAIEHAIGSDSSVAPMPWAPPVEEACALLRAAIKSDTGEEVRKAELLRILFDVDSAIPARLGWPEDRSAFAIAEARNILEAGGLNPVSAEAILRYARLGELLDGVLPHPTTDNRRRRVTRGDSIDRLLTHRVWGLIIFIVLVSVVFQSIYTFAVPLMDGIAAATGWIGAVVGGWLASVPMLQSLVVDGVIAGVGSVVIFLPQILILFFFIALLEDTGYMARAAFLMDRLFSWCGLNGKSFVPMLSSYACAVPGVLAARSIDDPKARLVTILISPLMSCSARLPVYVLLIGAFIEPVWGPFRAGLLLVAMHFVGLAVAIPVAVLLNRFVVRGRAIPFVMEMPPYRTPHLRSVLMRMWQGGEKFLRRAGTIIFAMTIVIWALCYFPRPGSVGEAARAQFVEAFAATNGVSAERALEIVNSGDNEAITRRMENAVAGAYIEQSYMGRLGKAIQPVFAPAGFDWKITVGVLASFPAREVIIATLGIVYNLGSDVDEESASLTGAMTASLWDSGPHRGERVFTPLVAIAIMVFFALCLQCGSTVAVIAREANWDWAVFAFCYMTALAWVGAVIVYQAGGALFAS